MSNHTATVKTKRVRFAPLVIATSIAAAALLSVSMSGTLSGFVASITNSNNTAASGTLVMEEKSTGTTPVTCLSTDGGTVSTNTATCSTINKFGGSTNMTPGQTVTTAITIKNAGTVAANTFTLTPGATCAQTTNGTLSGTATDFCSKVKVVITSGTTEIFNGTAATLAGSAAKSLGAVAAGVSTPFSIAVTLDSAANNTYQGLSASLPLTWSFAS
ncbi:hypothetical protein C1I63_00380 [Rathayibacter caricis DSM 15933]|uniref:Uncharacterized protein n=1 Tax=Rathayibacter caricis DSM 15933 TaxID=1328867 RepID=A0A2T4UPL1_9MICO|nr:hypothetical protein [Rathayibacter caricis]PTL71463.1 hypothetical protein C1I63_00380 [Rathayibacter caricis DSM 15933]